jgi:folate-dependent phosphoribosylglycinamide formyltransferase PurN
MVNLSIEKMVRSLKGQNISNLISQAYSMEKTANYNGKTVYIVHIEEKQRFALVSDNRDKSKAYKVDMVDLQGYSPIKRDR